MPRASKKKFEEDSDRVVKLLLENAKDAVGDIADQCGFSRHKVWRITTALEKKKVIWGYPAVVDDEKRGIKSYMLLIKKTPKPISKDIVDKAVKGEFVDSLVKMGVHVESSVCVRGFYDYVLCFTAEDIKKARDVCYFFATMFTEYIDELELLETSFVLRKCGIKNPEMEKLKDFLLPEL